MLHVIAHYYYTIGIIYIKELPIKINSNEHRNQRKQKVASARGPSRLIFSRGLRSFSSRPALSVEWYGKFKAIRAEKFNLRHDYCFCLLGYRLYYGGVVEDEYFFLCLNSCT